MNDKTEIGVRITGDGTSATAALKNVSDTVTKSLGDMQGALKPLGAAMDGVKNIFGGFVSVVAGAGIAALNKMVQQFADTVEGSRDLARSLGITTNEVAGLQAALDDVGATTGEYAGMAKAMQRQLNKDEEAMKAIGLATRDQSGNLRPLNDLMMDSIKIVNDHKEGTDRNLASQQLFGRSADGASRVMLLNTEVMESNRKAAEELGLVVGGNATAAWEEYDSASDRAGLTMKALGRAVGETVMPAITTLMTYFNSVAPGAILVIRGALSGLTTAFLGLVNGVRLVWEVINAMVFSVAEPIMALGRALSAIVDGDFKQAGKELASIPSNIGDAWSRAYDNMVASSEDTATKIKRLWAATAGDVGGTGTSGGSSGTRSATVKGNKKEGKEENRTGEWDAALQERKVVFQKENDLREMSKEMELAYWAEISQMADLTAKERVDLRKKVAAAELAVMKEQRTEELAMTEQSISALKDKQLAVLDAARQESQYLVDTQQMTYMEMLQADQDLEQKRFAIVKEAIQGRLALLEKDPTKNVVALQKLNDELAAVEAEHSTRMRGAQLAVQKEQLKDWQDMFNSIGSAFGNVVVGLVTRTMTLGQAVKSMFGSLLQSVGNFLAQMIAKRVAAWAIEKTIGMASIGTNAAVAGSGAAASQASIPYVGPILALAAMAAVFAAVSGMGGKARASAEGGFDIPAGLNPMTQLHEKEMVLPAEHADTIRSMAGSGAAGTIVINTRGGEFVHKDDLAVLLRKMNRNFEFKS